MAKTNRRPVDRLDRQQRLAQRDRGNDNVRHISTRNVDQFFEDLDEELDEHTVDQDVAA